ncbi:hypothetical protein E2C01_048900 [Portunus trituberculatus]|uniref:Uncharacterized protein n=1 Tax=Portunus trituberculatus TaxID=210409 RepID=A0A5B7G498_PORTR|nr:hypothetical protein [Portunus trituberculatus]
MDQRVHSTSVRCGQACATSVWLGSRISHVSAPYTPCAPSCVLTANKPSNWCASLSGAPLQRTDAGSHSSCSV